MKLPKSLLFLMLISIAVASCEAGKEKKQGLNPDEFARTEISKWRRELLANGEVGTPCDSDATKWISQNPESYYGLPDTIQFQFSDNNGDGINDLLLYFEAGESCTGGHQEGADFLTYLYSSGTDYLRNDHLRTEIAGKIGEAYFQQTEKEAGRVIFFVSGFEKEIKGTYRLWLTEDPDCCASVEGDFTYHPSRWEINITCRPAK